MRFINSTNKIYIFEKWSLVLNFTAMMAAVNSKSDSEIFTITVDPCQSSMRVDKYIHLRLSNTSRNSIQQALDEGLILVNKHKAKASYKIKPQDCITIAGYRTQPPLELIPEALPLDIIYEDKSLLIVDKPPNLVVHPGHGHKSGTLVNGLIYRYKNLPNNRASDKPGLVHRIDKNTSGLLLIAKTPTALTFLARQFAEHTIQRTYYALVWGVPKKSKGTIVNYLNRSSKDPRIRAVNPDNIGKKAITHYEVLEDLGFVALLRCQLETGRTHQIRVHLKHLGHPLFNDELYGGSKILKGLRSAKYKTFVENCFKILPRQALHAKTLGFIHPESLENMSFESPLPADFQGALERWQKWARQAFKY